MSFIHAPHPPGLGAARMSRGSSSSASALAEGSRSPRPCPAPVAASMTAPPKFTYGHETPPSPDMWCRQAFPRPVLQLDSGVRVRAPTRYSNLDLGKSKLFRAFADTGGVVGSASPSISGGRVSPPRRGSATTTSPAAWPACPAPTGAHAGYTVL